MSKFYANYFAKSISQTKLILFLLLLSVALLPAFTAQAQVSGTVFRDFNGNGNKDNSASFSEPGASGITVNAYDASGTLLASVVSNASGAYSFTSGQIPAATRVRLEFTGWSNGDLPTAFGDGNRTSIQFVTSPNSTANFGINYPGEYVDNANPKIIIPGYINGDNRVVGSTAAAGNAVYSYNYNATSGPTIIGNMGQIGSVWGTAYQKQTDKLFYGAFAKRHVAWGPLGSAGIYVTTSAKTASSSANTGSFVDLHAINPVFDAGTVTRNFANGNGNKSQANYDEQMFDKVGKVGIGGMCISDDGNYLYLINLNDRKLWRVDISGGAAPSSASQIVSYTDFPVNSANSTFRPFAVKYYRGSVYVGGVQDGVNPNTSAIDRNELTAYVYKVDASAAPGSASFTQVLTSPFTYNRNANLNSGFGGLSTTAYHDPNGTINTLSNTSWHPWTGTFSDLLVNGHPMYPQPILSGIEFDPVDGSMILGVMDRTGSQVGQANDGTNTGSNSLYTGNAAGDILRAANSGSSFTLENNGTSGSTTTVGAGNLEGPGGGEFYYTDRFRAGAGSATGGSGGNLGIGSIATGALGLDHEENSTGSLGIYPGKGEVLTSAYDAITDWYSGAVRYYSNTTGVATNGELLYQGSSVDIFGKANGLGDMELITGPAPIEVGNRVWFDANGNGLQDADEDVISGVTVQLIQSNVVIATAVTDANGEYYFSSDANRTSTASAIYNITQLTPNSNFIIRIPNVTGASKQSALTAYDLTIPGAGSNNQINSDGVLVGNNADASVTTGICGNNDHSYDFGFVTSGTVGGGGGGGLESHDLGDAVAQRVFAKAQASQNGKVDYNKLSVVGGNQTARPTTFGVGTSSVTLASIMPDISKIGFVAYNSTPTDIVNITNAKEVIATDFTVNKQPKAVAFATKTLGALYDHTKPICDRLKGASLLDVQNITVGGFNFVQYTMKDENGITEYATSFSVGTKAGRNNFSIQSTWLSKDYVSDDVMYNFQLWAATPQLVNAMITDVLTKVQNAAAVAPLVTTNIPATYVMSGNRTGTNLDMVINNTAAGATGYFTLEDKASESSTGTTATRQIPFTVNANGKSTVSIPMNDLYESTISMYVNGVMKDVVYMADGTWSVDYNKVTTTVNSFTLSNDANRVYDPSEYAVLRNASVKGNSSDYVSVFKLLKGGAAEADLTAYKGLKLTASGGYTLRVTLVKNSIVNWNDQYYTEIKLDDAQKDYYISMDKFSSTASTNKIAASDVTTVVFAIEVGTGKNSAINTTLSNISFTKLDQNYINSLESKEIQLYPNPATAKNFSCSFYSNAAQQLTLHVTDVMGRTVATQQVSAIKGLNVVPVALKAGTNGMHIVSLDGADVKYNSKKVVIN